MDVNELQASLQALMDRQKAGPAPEPVPVPADVLVASATPGPYDHLYAPADTTANQPAYQPYEFDDHLLEENEEAGDVKITNVANAIYRAKRTGFQGLLASVLVSVGTVLAAVQLNAEIDWKLLALALGQAVLTAVISFLHNDKTAESNTAE
ncbi:hypothetical protein Ssi03_12940 [Sphaerisporangium siamense]|uniref:Uncharacterized protein n=1 Tax=Sphaerisporangium siamense TaxID=795645 RepID=A0A7W7GB08_9ACTN|nr:hypothetical protein [Sphaerisporangium siamense]MBB4702937.1 hypothetical protein [Sphaerisporangium siamense]GII83304.1 hypothetical protein Ssi03_12940 [Sphaerisporangium siamense]